MFISIRRTSGSQKIYYHNRVVFYQPNIKGILFMNKIMKEPMEQPRPLEPPEPEPIDNPEEPL